MIKIAGLAKKQSVVVLIDTGSTHNFVDLKLVKQLMLKTEPMTRPIRVKEANEQFMRYNLICPIFKWKMNNEIFSFDLRVLNARVADIILGMDWIDTMSPIVLHTRPYSICFVKDEVGHINGL